MKTVRFFANEIAALDGITFGLAYAQDSSIQIGDVEVSSVDGFAHMLVVTDDELAGAEDRFYVDGRFVTQAAKAA